MMDKSQIKSAIVNGLTLVLDGILLSNGFSRRENSLSYRRDKDDAIQKIIFYFDVNPTYEPTADAHLLPQVTVAMKDLNRMAVEMVGGETTLIGDPDVTISQPFDICIPKKEHIRWFIKGSESVVPCLRSVAESLQTWILPFLDNYTTVASISHGYEVGDNKLLNQRKYYLYVAASYISQSRLSEALDVLETHFGKSSLRKKYDTAFDYLSKQAL